MGLDAYNKIPKATDERPSGGTLRAPVAWELPEKNMGSPTTASKATERAIDREERKLVNKAYATCKETLKTNRALMQALVDALLDRETVDGAELERLVAEKAVVSTFAAA